MTESTRNNLLFISLAVVMCALYGTLIYYYMWSHLIDEINKIDWYYVLVLSFKLLFWFFYFSILKSQVKFFTIVPMGKEITDRCSLSEFLIYVWMLCLVVSGFIFFLLKDIENGIDCAIVSLLISVPYLTFRFVKYYVWDKKKQLKTEIG